MLKKAHLVSLKKLQGVRQIAPLKQRFLSFTFYKTQRSYEKIVNLFVISLVQWWKLYYIYIFSTQRRMDYDRLKRDMFFFYQGFLHRHWRFTGQQGKGGDHLLFHSTTSTCSRILRHLFATLHVRWLSRISNRNVCVYQTATQWDLPPYRITI